MKLPKEVRYKTLIELFASDLDISVSQHLNDGWKLHGTPFISPVEDKDRPGSYQVFYCQAVIGKDYPF